MIATHSVYNDDVLPALREFLNQRPAAMGCGAETLAQMLFVLRYLNRRPEVFAVEAALEALRVEGEVAA